MNPGQFACSQFRMMLKRWGCLGINQQNIDIFRYYSTKLVVKCVSYCSALVKNFMQKSVWEFMSKKN